MWTPHLHHKPRTRNQESSPALPILVSFFRYSFKYLDCGFKQLTCCQISSNGLRKKENRRLNFWKSLESFYCLLFPQQSRLNMYLITSHWPKLYLFPITMDWNRLSIKWYMYVHNILDNIFTFILITNESFVVFLGIGRADVIVTYSVKISDFLLSN